MEQTHARGRSSIWGAAITLIVGMTAGCTRHNDRYIGPLEDDMPAILLDLSAVPEDMNRCARQMGVPRGMVEVPGGTFTMGTDAEMGGSDYERPANQQTVARFYLDKTEVTVGQYHACVQAGACSPPDGGRNCTWTSPDMGTIRDTYPINCVDWNQAVAFCAWDCKRLPTEIEWEYAARGTMDSKYPWGNDEPNTAGKPETKACFSQNGACPVAQDSSTLLGKAAAGGVWDLAGNVWEWTASSWPCQYPLDPLDPACRMKPDKSSRVVRGGSWNNYAAVLRAAIRSDLEPSNRSNDAGFRCSRTP